MGLKDSYYNLASPTNVKQNPCTLTPSRNWWVSIQSFVLSKCASASFSDLPANSGLKCDQFNCGICCICYMGTSWSWATGGCTACCGCCGACGWIGGAGGPASAIFIYFIPI